MAVASPEEYLAHLNPAQREAVTAPEGPVLIVAGAGSGKTRVLTHRIVHEIRALGVKPNEILAITFTNRAANEMKRRLEALLGGAARTMWVMTFHAACGRILRREAPRLGLKSNFTIYDSADQVRLVKSCLEELDKDPKRFAPRGIHAQISSAKNQLVSPDEYLERVASFYDQTVAEVYKRYQERLHAANALDFDDLLVLTVEVLERFPEARARWQKVFRAVLVDEYQDTNHAQYRLLQLIAEKHRNVFAVGDPDQCLVEGTLVTMADGGLRPIEAIEAGDEVLSCYGSGRFGPARVTRTHRSSKRDGVAITTVSGRRIVSTPEHVHFAGFKARAMPQAHLTYLMWKAGVGFRVGTSRTYTSGTHATLGPAFRMNQEHADATWILSIHASEAEAREAEVETSLTYGLPTVPVVARRRNGSTNAGLVGNQEALDRLFARLDTELSGRELLHDRGLSFGHPHFSSATTTSGRRTRRRVTVALCGDARGAGPLHRVSLFGYDDAGRAALTRAGLPLRPAYAGSPGWRYESAYADFERVGRVVERIRGELDVSVR
ncbi:MAG TPA: UvrD-helicase domain-containing protein, partial [Gaiellaceae bacterium]|nr:UvrD-helicase domain-containing protein [Gaiellaceae bacterium]